MRGASVDTAVVCDGNESALFARGVSDVKAHTEFPELAVIFEYIEHSAHLGKDEDSTSLLLHALEQPIQDLHLSSVVYQMFICSIRWTRFCTIEKVRVVTAFPQLHHDIQQSSLSFLLRSHAIDSIDISLQERLVPFPLHIRHTHIKVDLLLRQ